MILLLLLIPVVEEDLLVFDFITHDAVTKASVKGVRAKKNLDMVSKDRDTKILSRSHQLIIT